MSEVISFPSPARWNARGLTEQEIEMALLEIQLWNRLLGQGLILDDRGNLARWRERRATAEERLRSARGRVDRQGAG